MTPEPGDGFGLSVRRRRPWSRSSSACDLPDPADVPEVDTVAGGLAVATVMATLVAARPVSGLIGFGGAVPLVNPGPRRAAESRRLCS